MIEGFAIILKWNNKKKSAEAATQTCSVNRAFDKISQN